jgi:hypothetical protein
MRAGAADRATAARPVRPRRFLFAMVVRFENLGVSGALRSPEADNAPTSSMSPGMYSSAVRPPAHREGHLCRGSLNGNSRATSGRQKRSRPHLASDFSAPRWCRGTPDKTPQPKKAEGGDGVCSFLRSPATSRLPLPAL